MVQTGHRTTVFRITLFGLLLSMAALLASTSERAQGAPLDTITLTSPNNVTIAESPDYATRELGNPWDMNDIGDIPFALFYSPPSASNGIWSATAESPNSFLHLQFQSFPDGGIYNYLGENDGVNYPINTANYTHLQVRLYVQSVNVMRSVVWYFLPNSPVPAGNSNFLDVRPGWNIYDLDLAAGGDGGTGNWLSLNGVGGLRFDVAPGVVGNNVQVDWVRLVPATNQRVNIAWTRTGTGNPNVNLYLSTSSDPNSDNEMLIATVPAGSNSYAWDRTGIAPGTYYIHAEMNGATSSSGPLIVNTAPVAHIDSPSPNSGEDYAQAVLGMTWDGSNLNQFQETRNVTNITYQPEYMQGSATNNDPQVSWLMRATNTPIDTSRYRYMNMRLWIQAPSTRPNAPWNAGPRMTWARDTGMNWQQTDAIIARYNQWMPVALDLPEMGLALGTQGWSGTETSLRFDVHEEDDFNGAGAALPQFFRIDKAHLTSRPISGQGQDPGTQPGSLIRWRTMQGSGQVDLHWDNNNSGFDGHLIASNLDMSDGSYAWDTSGMANGLYWVYLTAHDARNSNSWYSLVPLEVNSSSPSTIFSDVPTNYFAVDWINDLALRQYISGYSQNDGTLLFRPSNTATRGQLSKMVVLAAGWPLVAPTNPTFADVDSNYSLYTFVETAVAHGVVGGYACGGAGEPCDGQNRPYFRPGNNVTRAQTSKMIVVSRGWSLRIPPSPTFADVATDNSLYGYVETAVAHGVVGGYPCGGAGEPCDGQNRPYYRPGNNVTRAQLSKMLSLAIR
jgi:hypothetical protein